MGTSFVRKCSPVVGTLGGIWASVGFYIFFLGMTSDFNFPANPLVIILLLESLITFTKLSWCDRGLVTIYVFRGGFFLFISLLMLLSHHMSDLFMAIIFGIFCFISGLFLIISSHVVRFPHWKRSMLSGILQIAFSIFLFLPYPERHDGTVPQFIGMMMFIGGGRWLITALNLRKVDDIYSFFSFFSSIDCFMNKKTSEDLTKYNVFSENKLTVHVWTPSGSSKSEPIRNPLINRYIAAIDKEGNVSTGHAALEVNTGLYISLYPKYDIDRTPSEFLNIVKAIKNNDVEGIFKDSYVSESAAWCGSDKKVHFEKINRYCLDVFWEDYKKNTSYNLTWRNCSSSVAYALEAALNGICYGKFYWYNFILLFFIPELWMAAQLRSRALNMAWTPGLTLDYARCLHAISRKISNRK